MPKDELYLSTTTTSSSNPLHGITSILPRRRLLRIFFFAGFLSVLLFLKWMMVTDDGGSNPFTRSVNAILDPLGVSYASDADASYVLQTSSDDFAKAVADGEIGRRIERNVTAVSRTKRLLNRFRPIPKRVWAYWDAEKLEDVPWMVKAMINGWRSLNPDYNITLILNSQVWDYVGIPPPHNFWHKRMNNKQRANWIRLAILRQYGGFWIDASTILTGSLDIILNRQQELGTEAFAFYLDWFTLNKTIPVYETYFLATVPNGQWISAWMTEYNMVFSNFWCGDAYLKHLVSLYGNRTFDAIAQRINDVSYLKLTVASQKVITLRGIPLPDRVETTLVPYKTLQDSNYDDWLYAKNLLEPVKDWKKRSGQASVPLVFKLRTYTRDAIEEHLFNMTADGEVSGPPVLPPRASVFGKYVMRYWDKFEEDLEKDRMAFLEKKKKKIDELEQDGVHKIITNIYLKSKRKVSRIKKIH
ncbi:hypothetical protein HDU97_006930 [Phlyctochytrium planicorne]|nr:hypothetical protein HDU97_006930 [Phlyctochytrium planicorne]